MSCLLLAAEKKKKTPFYTTADGEVTEAECNYPRVEVCLTPFTLMTSTIASLSRQNFRFMSEIIAREDSLTCRGRGYGKGKKRSPPANSSAIFCSKLSFPWKAENMNPEQVMATLRS